MWSNLPQFSYVYSDINNQPQQAWPNQFQPVPSATVPPPTDFPQRSASFTIQPQLLPSDHRNNKRRRVLSNEEKALRSRERNRMHARKTRQRKKLQIRMLRNKVEELEEEQRRLRQALNDRKTANILLAMSASPYGCNTQLIDIEALNDDDISLNATASTTTAYGDSNSIEFGSENRSDDEGDLSDSSHDSDEGNDVDENDRLHCRKDLSDRTVISKSELQTEADLALKLLGKEKDMCSAQELELIRRERNRMHAKKTRDKKKMYVTETEVTISRLELENRQLRESIQKLGTLSIVLPVRPAPEAFPPNPHVAGAQLLMNMMNDSHASTAATGDNVTKNSDTQSETNSESESNSSLEPRSSSSNGNGSSRSDDSNSVDDESNACLGNSHEYHINNDYSNGNCSG